ncbi:rhomboid-like protein, partial [Trypanosoma cruzi]
MLRCWRTFPFTCNANGLSSRMASRLLQRRGVSLVGPAKSTFFALYNAQKQGMCVSACRCPGRAFSSTPNIPEQKNTGDYLAGFREGQTYKGKGEKGGKGEKK